MADTGEKKYSNVEAINRILRVLIGAIAPDDAPGTLAGSILSIDGALSKLAEVLEGNDPEETLTLPDANYGNIISNGDITATGTVNAVMLRQSETWHAYGGFQTGTATISISNVNVWYHVTNGTNDLWTGLEADGMTLSGDVITITNHGDYVGTLSMTLSGLATKDFEVRVYNITQGIQMGFLQGCTTTGAANYVNVTLPLYLECDAGDQLRIEVRCVTDSSDPTFEHAVFELHYLHR